MRINDMDPVSPGPQSELLHHEGMEQAHQVGTGAHDPLRIVERLLRRTGPTELWAPLENEHALSATGQVGRRRQPVVAAAHHDDVPRPGGQLGHGRR